MLKRPEHPAQASATSTDGNDLAAVLGEVAAELRAVRVALERLTEKK